MAERADRYWRMCATGICFSSFGLGGLVLRVFVFPILNLLVWQRERRERAARAVIRRTLGFFVALMRFVGVMSYELRGAEKLQRHGLLIVANHPSLIDVVFLLSLVERADCIVKGALKRNPFTRGPICGANFISNDSGAGLIEDCIASVRAGNNLIIFPEGTRTTPSSELRLQRGAANVAVRGNLDITPVCIRVSLPFLTKGVKWYRVPPRRAHFIIAVGDDIEIKPFIETSASEALATRRLNEYLTGYLSAETSCAST